jgi:hypothetical protein
MPKLSYYSLFFSILAFCACQNPNLQNTNPNVKKAYFDIPNFFAQEAQNLEKGRNLSKTVEFNGKKTVAKVSITDWQRELSIFSRVDLNRNEWLDKYEKANFFDKNNSQLIHTRYTANDSSLSTKAVDIYYQNNEAQTITIINNIQNGLFEQQQYLLYRKNELIEIMQIQKTDFWAHNNYKVQIFLR